MNWLRAYHREWLRPDIIAGLTTAAVVLPKAMAYATIAGLPVEVGIYTMLVPMAVYALLGSSRALSVSTSTLIDCSAVPDIEYTALEMFTDGEQKLQQEGITLWLAALNPEALRVIRRSSLGKVLGRGRMFFNVQQAVEAYANRPALS